MTREYQVSGSARVERALTILQHVLPIAKRDGVPMNLTSKMFASPPYRLMLQQRFGSNRLELFAGRKLMAATWGDGNTGLHVEYLRAGTDWIADLLRELH